MTDYRLLTFLIIFLLVPLAPRAQCPIFPSKGIIASDWDAIFTQDGPGKGLEPGGSAGWTGGDSTYSLLLPNGDSAFFFSDSYIAESPKTKGDGTVTRSPTGLRTTEINCLPPICDPPASSFNARNSIVVLDRERKHMRLLAGPKNENGLSTSYFRDPAPGLNFWMGDAILLPKSGKTKQRLFVFLHKFDSKLAFHGAAIAELDPKTLAIRKTIEINNLPNLSIHWGTAMIDDGGYLYIYGKGTRAGRKQMFVARTRSDVSIDQLADVSNWTAWNGNSWSRDLTAVLPIIPATDGISDEFNVVRFKINGKLTYMFAGIDSTVPWGSWRDITLYSSCSPEGPFTGKHVVYAMPESNSFTLPGLAPGMKLREHLVVYNPHIHPQFSGSGRLLISYNLNRTHNSDSIYIDGYRPRFVYVPVAGLEKITK
jgi:hypothetical protein